MKICIKFAFLTNIKILNKENYLESDRIIIIFKKFVYLIFKIYSKIASHFHFILWIYIKSCLGQDSKIIKRISVNLSKTKHILTKIRICVIQIPCDLTKYSWSTFMSMFILLKLNYFLQNLSYSIVRFVICVALNI